MFGGSTAGKFGAAIEYRTVVVYKVGGSVIHLVFEMFTCYDFHEQICLNASNLVIQFNKSAVSVPVETVLRLNTRSLCQP